MKYVIILYMCITNIYALSLNDPIKPLLHHDHIVTKLFNRPEIQIKKSYQEEIKNTFEMFHTAPLKDLIPSLEQLVMLLEKEENNFKHNCVSKKDQLSSVITQIQKEHIIKYLHYLYSNLNQWQKIVIELYKSTYTCCAFIKKKILSDYTSYQAGLTQQFYWYTTFEREHLLINYMTALEFFSLQRKIAYPPAFYFWKEEPDKVKVLMLLQQVETNIIPQSFVVEGEAADIAAGDAGDILGATLNDVAEQAAQKGEQQAQKAIDNALANFENGITQSAIDQTATALQGLKPGDISDLAQQMVKKAQNIPDLRQALEKEGITAASDITPKNALQSANKILKTMQDHLDKEAAENLKLLQDSGFGGEGEDVMDVEALIEDNQARKAAAAEALQGQAAGNIGVDSSVDHDLNAQETEKEPLTDLETKQGQAAEDTDTDGDSDQGLKLRKTGRERFEELVAERKAIMKELEAKINDPDASAFSKLAARVQLAAMKIFRPLTYIADRLDAHVSSELTNILIKRFGAHADRINAILKSTPSEWQGVTDILVQMEVMQASSLVQFWYQEEDAQRMQEWQLKQVNMVNLNTRFINLMKLQQNQNLTFANQKFVNNVQTLSANQNQQQGLSLFDQMWMERAVLTTLPANYFIDRATDFSSKYLPAITNDLGFSLSAMITPETLANQNFTPHAPGAWHNVYKVGNWQFLPELQSFFQLALVPYSGTSLGDQAASALSNIIFKEYIPVQQAQYLNSITCTLYNYQFPFFVGLLFNKGRWVSGIPDRENQTRFAGLYGTSDKKIYFVCEESKNSSAQELAQGAPSTQSPFYRILSNSNEYEIEQNQVTLTKLPVTFTITTTSYDMTQLTSCTHVTAQLNFKNSPNSYLISNSAFSVDNGLYHGVGFVSSGCITQFVINQPTELVYTQNQIDAMKTNLASLLTSTPQEGS